MEGVAITTFSGGTVDGNILPSQTGKDLGSAAQRWDGFFQDLDISGAFSGPGLLPTGSYYFPGTASGTATAPSTMPDASATLSGGSIADGTYYFKITYFNKNGETTASPTKTLVVSGGGGLARVYVSQADTNWQTGCYGYLVYASNDNVNFYAQTPSGTVADFELTNANGGAPAGKTGHYVALGSTGARFNSLTFSGTLAPTTNTATIDPLQVALNQTRSTLYAGSVWGTVMVPNSDATTAYLMTTPLILSRYQRLLGTSHYGVGKSDAGQSRIYSTYTQSKLATIMTFGGFHSIENMNAWGSGHGVMLLAGVGLQAEAEIAKNSAFRTTDTTNTYAGLKIVGIHYNIHHDNVYLRGGKATIQVSNASGGEWSFDNTRWDLGGSSAIQNITSWTDPDNGTNDAAFKNGVSRVWLSNILVEVGNGILLDAVNMGIEFDRVEFADYSALAGTDSVAKTGVDSFSGGQAPSAWILRDSFIPGSANARVGMNIIAGSYTAPGIIMYGNSGIGSGGSTGVNQSLDLNSQSVTILTKYGNPYTGGNGSTPAFSPSATNGKIINMAAGQDLTAIGVPDNIAGGSTRVWNEFVDRLVLRGTASRATRKSFFMNGNQLELRQSDDVTTDFIIYPTNGNMDLRGNLRVQATGGANAQFLIGPSTATPAEAASALGLVNNSLVAWRNAANTADIGGWRVNASDEMESLAPLGIMPLADLTPHGKTAKRFAYVGTLQGAVGGVTPAAGAFTTLTSSGLYTNYNGIATVSNGIPAEYAVIDLTAQTAAKTATLLYAVPASGQGAYRVSWVATVTTAATTSCVLGGTNGFQVQFTSPTDSVVKTSNPTTVSAYTSAINATGTTVSGTFNVYAKASTNINYLFDYTSVGGTPMAYELHIVCEKL